MSQAVDSNSQSFVETGEKAFQKVGDTLGALASRFSFVSTMAKFSVGAAATAVTNPEEFKNTALQMVTSTARNISERVDGFIAQGVEVVNQGIEADKAARVAVAATIKENLKLLNPDVVKSDIRDEINIAKASLVNAALSLQEGVNVNGKPVFGTVKAIEASSLTANDKEQLTGLYTKTLAAIKDGTQAKIAELEEANHTSRKDYTEARLALQQEFGNNLAKLSADTREVVGTISNTIVKQSRRTDYAEQTNIPDHKPQIQRAWKEARRETTYDMPAYGRGA